MSQLGSGNGSSYPAAIDTRQTFQNSPVASPDSASRIDAELANDALHGVVAIETALGANPQGTFASLAARLQQFLPGGGSSPLAFTFLASTSVLIPGTSHRLGTPVPLIQAYDQSTPRVAIEPDSVTISQLTYDVTLGFLTPQSGLVSLASPLPIYVTSFTAQTSVTVPGSTHLLGTAALLLRVYVSSGTDNVLIFADATVHPSTFDVTLTFATPQTGSLVLSAAGPRYVTSFVNQTSVPVSGAIHQLGSAALLFQIYDDATPHAVIRPDTLTVHPTSFNVTVTFATPQSGSLVLVKATEISGTEFEIRDGGITNTNAVRVFSAVGSLNLQMGSGQNITLLTEHGAVAGVVDHLGNLEITGTATKPGGGSWLSSSDARLKEVLGPFADGLDLLIELEPVRFRYNGTGGMRSDGQAHIGLIAQEVEACAPYMVSSRPGRLTPQDDLTNLLVLDTSALPYVLINSVKELLAQNHTLRNDLAVLTAALQELERRVAAQETQP